MTEPLDRRRTSDKTARDSTLDMVEKLVEVSSQLIEISSRLGEQTRLVASLSEENIRVHERLGTDLAGLALTLHGGLTQQGVRIIGHDEMIREGQRCLIEIRSDLTSLRAQMTARQNKWTERLWAIISAIIVALLVTLLVEPWKAKPLLTPDEVGKIKERLYDLPPKPLEGPPPRTR